MRYKITCVSRCFCAAQSRALKEINNHLVVRAVCSTHKRTVFFVARSLQLDIHRTRRAERCSKLYQDDEILLCTRL